MIQVTMVLRYQNRKTTEKQHRKFIETVQAGFWQLVDNNNEGGEVVPEITTTTWSREFKEGKKPKQILKTAQNLVLRAAEYGDILHLEAEVIIGDNPPETFSHLAEKPSEYFKNKTWR